MPIGRRSGPRGAGQAVDDIDNGALFLLSHTAAGLLALMWYVVLFDFPRYVLPFIVLAATRSRRRPGYGEAAGVAWPFGRPSVSVIIVGHNEAGSIEACVRSLHEQSISGLEIVVVSDGSSDRMARTAAEIVKRGEAKCIVATATRGGKSSGVNLAMEMSTGDIIVNVDCDCSFDRFAIERMIEPFADPRVGATCGDIVPRNAAASLITQIQEIEYLKSITVGKRFANLIGQVTCASGAFGAFRRSALTSVGGLDVGGGEDLDVTIRLRQAGWRIAFAPESVSYTDVPATVRAYARQRLRWERDAVWIRYRKHRRLMNPFSARFSPTEALHQWDFLLFNVIAAFMFPVYLVGLAGFFGASVIPILVALQVALFILDLGMLALASQISGRRAFWHNLPFLPAYSFFMAFVMRPVRAYAYLQEWLLFGSHGDSYVPPKVRRVRAW